VSALEGPPQVRSNGGEPVLAATITAAVTSLIALAVAFGLDLTDAQQASILGVVAVAGPVIAGIYGRSRVTPSESVLAVRSSDGDVLAGPAATVTTGDPVQVSPAPQAFPLEDPPRHLAD